MHQVLFPLIHSTPQPSETLYSDVYKCVFMCQGDHFKCQPPPRFSDVGFSAVHLLGFGCWRSGLLDAAPSGGGADRMEGGQGGEQGPAGTASWLGARACWAAYCIVGR